MTFFFLPQTKSPAVAGLFQYSLALSSESPLARDIALSHQ
jgi:hypothetical protein